VDLGDDLVRVVVLRADDDGSAGFRLVGSARVVVERIRGGAGGECARPEDGDAENGSESEEVLLRHDDVLRDESAGVEWGAACRAARRCSAANASSRMMASRITRMEPASICP